MAKIFPIVRRIITVVGGGANFHPIQKFGVKTRLLFQATLQQARAGLVIFERLALLRQQRVGLLVDPTFLGSSEAVQDLGVETALRLGASGTEDKPAANIVQITYALTRRVGAAVATAVDPGGAGTYSAFTNPTNAQGLHNGTVTSMSASATQARRAGLRLDYADPVNKTELEITNVKLHFYYQISGTLLNNGEFWLYERHDGSNAFTGATQLAFLTGDANTLTTPDTYDLGVLTWQQITDLVALAKCESDALEGMTYSIDAVEVEITANRTDAL